MAAASDFCRRSNGDGGSLFLDDATGGQMVRYEPNYVALGGKITEADAEEVLERSRSTPQAAALLKYLGRG